MTAPFIPPHIHASAAGALLDEVMPPRTDRLLGRRTCGEIVAGMAELRARELVEREAFTSVLVERAREQREQQEAIWAREGDAFERVL